MQRGFVKYIKKLNTPVAVLVVLVFFFAVNGFLLYGYQRSLQAAGNVADQPIAGIDSAAVGETVATAEAPASEDATERKDETTAFVHRAAPQNIVENSTYLDYPLANGNPDAILLVARGSEPGGEAYDAHRIGVWYDANRGGRWAVFNQDLAPMPEGAVFDMVVSEEPGGAVFVHRAAPDDTVGNETYVDHPSTNGTPDTVLSVTPNWNPGGGAGIYLDHPVGVRYDADEEKWTILNRDLAPMPEGAAFNVAVSGDTPTAR